MSKFAIGDRVRFADAFIASVQGHELKPLRGTVVAYLPYPGKGKPQLDRVSIRWDDEDGTRNAIVRNISKAR